MTTSSITPGLRIEEQMRDLIDKTIQHFGRLNGAAHDTIAEGQPRSVTGQAAGGDDLGSQPLCPGHC